MTTLRRFRCDDLFNFNAVNLDFFTETVRAWLLSLHRLTCGSAWLPSDMGPCGFAQVHASMHWPLCDRILQTGQSYLPLSSMKSCMQLLYAFEAS